MKTIFTLLLICGYSAMMRAQQGPPVVPEFAVEGARWYYKNTGKNNDIVKHIYVERKGYKFVEAFNFTTSKYQQYAALRLIFHYLDKDSAAVDYDTLYVRYDTGRFEYYVEKYKIFDPVYAGIINSNTGRNVTSANPFIWNNAYMQRRMHAQKLVKATCATINNKTLGFYELESHPCNFYPIGVEIIERIGSTFYMFRTDSCGKDGYGGPLLWYFDPEIGLYEHGKTKIEMCEYTEPTDTTFTAIENQLSLHSTIKTYPTPFTNSLNLENINSSSVMVYIYTLDGKCFYKVKLYGNENKSINTIDWKTGVYVIKFENEDGVSARKIINL